MSEVRNYRTQEEAIVAAIDDMKSGDKLTVHREHCRKFSKWWRRCTCEPDIWVCP